MPNWVTTTLSVEGPPARVDEFKFVHIVPERDEKYFDFNTVVPQPACLEGIVAGSLTSMAAEAITGKDLTQLVAERNPTDDHAQMAAAYHVAMRDRVKTAIPQLKGQDPERLSNLTVTELEAGMLALKAIEECGYPTWYEWSVAKWGTKWNCGDFRVVSDEPGLYVCRFDTAWSTPVPVFEELAKMHPTLQFTTDSYDEFGNFALHGSTTGGIFSEEDVEPNDASYEAAHGCAPEHFAEVEEDANPATVSDAEADDPLGSPVPQKRALDE